MLRARHLEEMLIMLAVARKNQKALSLLMQASLDDDKPTLYGETILHTYALQRRYHHGAAADGFGD